MKLWHLIAIGGIAYLLLRKKTPVVTAPVAVPMTPEQLKAAQEAAAAAAAGAAAAAAGAGVPGAGPLPMTGISWAEA